MILSLDMVLGKTRFDQQVKKNWDRYVPVITRICDHLYYRLENFIFVDGGDCLNELLSGCDWVLKP